MTPESVHKLLFGLMMLISVPPSRPTVHVLRRTTLAQTECTIFQRIHYDLGAPMKYPPHHGAEQNLAAATQCNQDDRHRGLRGQQDDWTGPHRDTKLWKLAHYECADPHRDHHL